MDIYKISRVESIILIVFIMITNIILNFPEEIIQTTASSSILSVFFVTLIAIFISYIIYLLFKPFESYDIFDVANFLAGKWLKILLGIIFFSLIIFKASLFLRTFSECLKVTYFSNTKILLIISAFIIAATFSSKYGTSSIIKSSILILPIALLSIVVICIFSSKNFIFERIYPLLGYGLKNTFVDGSLNIYAFSNLLYLYLIVPNLKQRDDFKFICLFSSIISGILLILVVSTFVLAFPFFISTEEILTLYTVSTLIEIGKFIQQLDAVFIFTWIVTILGYLSISITFSCNIFQKLTNIKYTKHIVFPISLLILGISLVTNNVAQLAFLENVILKYITIIFIFIIPISILILANLKYKQKKHTRKDSLYE